jgi:hypothetical protein
MTTIRVSLADADLERLAELIADRIVASARSEREHGRGIEGNGNGSGVGALRLVTDAVVPAVASSAPSTSDGEGRPAVAALGVAAAAAYVGVREGTLRKLLAAGRVPGAVKVLGTRRWSIPVGALDALLSGSTDLTISRQCP